MEESAKCVPKRIKLVRRTRYIEQNLKNLETCTSKKRFAQKKYYEYCRRDNPKMPVHARLGTKPINLRRGAYKFHQNNSGFVSKNKFRLKNNLYKNGRIRLIRSQYPQGQLNLRRSGPRLGQNNRPMDYTIQIKNNFPRNNFLNYNYNKHSCLQQLDQNLQDEIHLIQQEAMGKSIPEIIPDVPIHVQGYGFTSISLSTRFSM